MARLPQLPIAAALVLAFTGAPVAGNSTLQLDGRLFIQSASMRTARVVVTQNDQELYVLTDDLRHLKLSLDLQEVYLLTFERKGCRSKSILFDTRMSEAEVVHAPFFFRFDVTLELVAPGADRSYAGPVGYVRYSSGSADFGYDLDYRLTHDEKGRLLAGAGEAAISSRRARSERHQVRPFIDPTQAMERAAMMRAGMASCPAEDQFAIKLPTEGILAIGTPATPRIDRKDQQRSVIIEQEREITIVRVKEQGKLNEYRRIRHSNGTVLHFKNGSNCSYQDFMAAVGEQ